MGVVLADDHPLVRQGLRAVIETTDDIEVVAEAEDGNDAVRLCVEHRPDVVLMDLQLPGLHGIEATRQVRRGAPETVVLVLTMFDDDDTVLAAISAGAAGYLLKGSGGADILAAVRSAAAGQAVFGADLTERVRGWMDGRPRAGAPPFPELTDRERDILDGVAAGLTNAEIGQRLFLAPKTIANNLSTILDKLHVSHRTEAIVKAREAGLGRG
ncbi:response regulator transcription factor [Nocardioides guangzhouensis]|uniref:Response regulator transcription factor n=1 Tax=Nocardioides guangzhouensis TaxID=2497878 RepID=A0A4Q4Z535_9ACTN|nr:response regulator transcription factor [Nocardioides guangzhouensis]